MVQGSKVREFERLLARYTGARYALATTRPEVITTGEGGMLVNSNEKTATLIESLRNHGGSVDGTDIKPYTLPEFPRVGFNHRMTDIRGTLGVAQMNRLDWILKVRKRLADRYNEELGDCKWLKPQSVPVGSIQSYTTAREPIRFTCSNITGSNMVMPPRTSQMRTLQIN